MSTFSFGAVFGSAGVTHGGKKLKCKCGNFTSWRNVQSDKRGMKATCGKCGATVKI